MQTAIIPSESMHALEKLTEKQLNIFRNILVALKQNNPNKVVEIVMNASQEDTEALYEVLKHA